MTSEKTLSAEELEARWSALRRVLDSEDAAACCSAIQSEGDDERRDQLYRFAIRKLGGGAGASAVELDAMVTIGDAATAEIPGREAQVNVMCFNLSANLCDCWGDGDSRERRHFESGLRYADRALELRRILKKDAASCSMAHLARGKHLLSLGRADEAVEAFQEAVNCEQIAARENGLDPATLKNARGGLLNSRAFLGLAMIQSSMSILRDRVEHGEGEMKDDAQVYLQQIQESVKRI